MNTLSISQKEIEKNYQPVKLLKSIRFPTYQLYAKVSNRKIEPKTALKIAALETMSWLRKRFREREIPSFINLLEPDNYQRVGEEDLKSFHIDEGYILDVIYIEEKGIWSLQLTEPDLGSDPGNINQKREAVPGRTFQTNVAFRIYNGELQCGFKTLCSQIEGTTVPCEVYRLTIVKQMVRNKLLGLKQIYPIIEETHPLENPKDIDKLKEFINNEERQLPLVILTKMSPKINFKEIEEEVLNHKRNYLDNIPRGETRELLPGVIPKLPFEEKGLVKYKMGFAHFIIVNQNLISTFNDIMGKEYLISDGDVRIIFPLKYNEDTLVFKEENINKDPNKFLKEIESQLQDYPKGKNIDFGNTKFLEEARLIELEEIINSSKSKKEAIEANNSKIDIIKKVHIENINNLKRELEESKDIIIKVKEKLKIKEEELIHKDEKWQGKMDKEKILDTKEIDDLKEEIKRKEQLLERPRKPEEIPEFVEKHFSGKLIFHERAKDQITKTLAYEVDMNLLCDALEYLAWEYRDELMGIITSEKSKNISAKKYKRPFTVCPSGDKSIEKFPKEYKIKYGLSYTGKLVEVPLDFHLKVGVDNEKLLRIYFLFDKKEKLIVVGSLPKHLNTISY